MVIWCRFTRQFHINGKINGNIHQRIRLGCMNWSQTHALVTGGTRRIRRVLVGILLVKGATVTATGLTSASVD